MPLDKQVNVRLSAGTHQAAQRVADRMTDSLRRRVTVSDVVRLAVEDYLRRNP